MVFKNHWGIMVDSEEPTTGVMNINHAEWLHEYIYGSGSIDTYFEEHLKECKNEYHDNCYYSDTCEGVIFGFKKNEETGKYDIDKEAEFSVIFGEIYAQIVHSKWVSRCALCSPCYPGQASLDEEGEFLAYNLPPDVYGEYEHLEIIKLEDIKHG